MRFFDYCTLRTGETPVIRYGLVVRSYLFGIDESLSAILAGAPVFFQASASRYASRCLAIYASHE